MSKKLLIVTRRSPYGGSLAREALDVALAASIYDQDVGILFMDDGVFQLLKNQQPDSAYFKNFGANLSALCLYGIEKIYAHKESLQERGLIKENLILDSIQILSNKDVEELLYQQDHLLSF